MRTVVETDRTVPNIWVQWVWPIGAAERPANASVAELAVFSDLFMRGTKTRSRQAVSEDLEAIGATLSLSSGPHYTRLSLETLTEYLKPAVEIVHDCLHNAVFSQREFEKAISERISDRLASFDDDDELVSEYFRRALFTDHPYGEVLGGTLSGLKSATLDGTKSYYDRLRNMLPCLVTAAGDISSDQVAEITRSVLGEAGGASSLVAPRDLPVFPGVPRIQVIEKPDREQNYFVMGQTLGNSQSGARRDLLVGNTVLGGSFTSRFTREIREMRGLSYGAGTGASFGLWCGDFTAFAFPSPARLQETLELASAVIQQFCESGPSPGEIEFAREFVAGRTQLSLRSAGHVAMRRTSNILLGLDEYEFANIRQHLGDVTATAVTHAFQKTVNLSDFTIAIAGEADKVLSVLNRLKWRGAATVVPYDAD